MSSTLAAANGELTNSMLLQFIGTQLAKFLTKEHVYKDAYYRVGIENIKSMGKKVSVIFDITSSFPKFSVDGRL